MSIKPVFQVPANGDDISDPRWINRSNIHQTQHNKQNRNYNDPVDGFAFGGVFFDQMLGGELGYGRGENIVHGFYFPKLSKQKPDKLFELIPVTEK